MSMRTILLSACAACMALASPAAAQDQNAMPDGTTQVERDATAALNREQAARLKSAAEAEATAKAQYDAAMAQYQAQMKAYEEATARYEADKARLAAMSAEDRIRWENDVAACKDGDTSKCAPEN